MAFTLPRISITVDDNRGMGTQGELSTLSLGFGIHQAWIYTAMFGSESLLQAPPLFGTASETSLSLVFFISIVVFALSLLFAAATDQKFLKFYTTKHVLLGSALLTSLGTFTVFAAHLPGQLGMIATAFSGVSTGVGSAILLLFWGTAYSRKGAASIVMNTAVAIVIAVAIYSFILHVIPTPFSGMLTACLPLLELPLLWKLTPVSYATRHVIPIFNPLPIKKGPFVVRFAVPVLLFGFALGAIRSISTQIILPSSDLTTQLLALFAGGAATVLLLVAAFSIDKRSHWDFLFRPLIPFIVVTLFFLPSLTLEDSMVTPLVLLTGYMCFEALMWVFFGDMSQEFRLSPIFVFGIGRGCLALGSLAGSFAVANPAYLNSLVPFGEAGGAMLLMLVMVIAYALLPQVRDIKRIIAPHTDSWNNTIATFNRQIEQNEWALHHVGGGAPPALPSEDAAVTKEAELTGWRMAQSTQQDPGAQPANNNSFDVERSQKSGRFRSQCEIIANRYLLSRRETEVMFLLAKGHNAAYIQDKLCVSKSTAKTHISHIYRKLDIHTQQELLGMVDEAKNNYHSTIK